MNKKVILLILDGWGLGKADKYNAIENAHTPNYDRLVRDYPNTRLKSDGLSVGLPEGQVGTSEVNHMTIGTGRVIMQDLPKINNAIKSGEFFQNNVLRSAIHHAQEYESNLHLIGIVSDGGIHTTSGHPLAIIKLASELGFRGKIFIHAFSDGRDTPPRSAEAILTAFQGELARFQKSGLDVQIASYQGRFYLDRDRDWSKTEKAANLILKGEGQNFSNWQAVVNFEYGQNNNDEFFGQYLLVKEGIVEANDSIIFFHYRTDRLYQIVKMFSDSDIKNLKLATFVSVGEEFSEIDVAFPRSNIEGTLAESIANAKKKQLHITETEKFTHLTYFFNGAREQEYVGERWELIKSNRYVKPHYNYEPSMQNFRITKQIVDSIDANSYDFIVANLSSPDMVGHSGNYEAAVISAESIDYCLGKIYTAIKDKLKEYSLIITADHGNSDIMWDYENNQPHTQHTTNPVPFILVSDLKCKLDRRESLEDVAPTVLDLMGIGQPIQMIGTSLILNLDSLERK